MWHISSIIAGMSSSSGQTWRIREINTASSTNLCQSNHMLHQIDSFAEQVESLLPDEQYFVFCILYILYFVFCVTSVGWNSAL